MSRALSLLLVAASTALLVTDTLNLSTSRLRAAGDMLVVAAAMLSVGGALSWKGMSDGGPAISRTTRAWTTMSIPALAVAVTLVHVGGFDAYQVTVALVVGLSVIAIAEPSGNHNLGAPLRMPAIAGVALFVVGVLFRFAAPGSLVQSWVLAPLIVLVLPGLAWSPTLLPDATGWLPRLFWAPVFSLGAQIVLLLWLDLAGIRASLPVFIAIAAGLTFSGLAATHFGTREPLP